MVSQYYTLPQEPNKDHAHHIQEQQTLNETTLNLDISKKPHGMAQESYVESTMLSKQSLERVSPLKIDNEVIRYPFNISLLKFTLKLK